MIGAVLCPANEICRNRGTRLPPQTRNILNFIDSRLRWAHPLAIGFSDQVGEAHAFYQGNRDRAESEGSVRRREPGEPPLSLFAQKADVEGFNDVAAVFRSTAEGETGHAHGHLEYLEEVGDPATGDNLKAAIVSETHDYTDMYPGMARGPPGRLRRDRRLVRDARQGWEVACRPLPKGARCALI